MTGRARGEGVVATASADHLLAPLAGLLDLVVADAGARDAAKLALLREGSGGEGDAVGEQLAAIVAAAQGARPWTAGARPGFLYVMYALLLWSVPLGLIAAIRPSAAAAIVRGTTGYLAGIPEPLYALFGTGYLGYTVARTWGRAKGVEP